MKIRDNGVGFNVKAKKETTSSSSGVGLKSMLNRAKLIGGEISFQSSPGSGTTVTVALPLPV
jgi:signal transduction histidine kinase